MATQHFKRNLLLNLYREGKTYRWFVSSCAKEREQCLALAAYFLRLETPGLPACFPLISFHNISWKNPNKLVNQPNIRVLQRKSPQCMWHGGMCLHTEMCFAESTYIIIESKSCGRDPVESWCCSLWLQRPSCCQNSFLLGEWQSFVTFRSSVD